MRFPTTAPALKLGVFGYRVAGKTGTIRKYDPARRGYSDEAHLSVFVGFAPVSRPRIAIVALVDEPSGSYYGGLVAAPIFSAVATAVLRLLDVAPDNLPAETKAPADDSLAFSKDRVMQMVTSLGLFAESCVAGATTEFAAAAADRPGL